MKTLKNYQQPLPPGALWMKEWVIQQAESDEVTRQAIYMRLARGKYPDVQRIGGPQCTGKRHCFIVDTHSARQDAEDQGVNRKPLRRLEQCQLDQGGPWFTYDGRPAENGSLLILCRFFREAFGRNGQQFTQRVTVSLADVRAMGYEPEVGA